jgi:hypothetical protein
MSGQRHADPVRRARAWLSRAVKPASLPLHRFLAEVGPVDAVAAIQRGRAPAEVAALVAGLVRVRTGTDRTGTELDLLRRIKLVEEADRVVARRRRRGRGHRVARRRRCDRGYAAGRC